MIFFNATKAKLKSISNIPVLQNKIKQTDIQLTSRLRKQEEILNNTSPSLRTSLSPLTFWALFYLFQDSRVPRFCFQNFLKILRFQVGKLFPPFLPGRLQFILSQSRNKKSEQRNLRGPAGLANSAASPPTRPFKLHLPPLGMSKGWFLEN